MAKNGSGRARSPHSQLHILGSMHGYGIATHIERVSDELLSVEEGSLSRSPWSRAGWVRSEWATTEST